MVLYYLKRSEINIIYSEMYSSENVARSILFTLSYKAIQLESIVSYFLKCVLTMVYIFKVTENLVFYSKNHRLIFLSACLLLDCVVEIAQVTSKGTK